MKTILLRVEDPGKRPFTILAGDTCGVGEDGAVNCNYDVVDEKTCKWGTTKSYFIVGCCKAWIKDRGLAFSYSYCPFCGRKIERI